MARARCTITMRGGHGLTSSVRAPVNTENSDVSDTRPALLLPTNILMLLATPTICPSNRLLEVATPTVCPSNRLLEVATPTVCPSNRLLEVATPTVCPSNRLLEVATLTSFKHTAGGGHSHVLQTDCWRWPLPQCVLQTLNRLLEVATLTSFRLLEVATPTMCPSNSLLEVATPTMCPSNRLLEVATPTMCPSNTKQTAGGGHSRVLQTDCWR